MNTQFQTATPDITPPPMSRSAFLAGLERLQSRAASDRIIVNPMTRTIWPTPLDRAIRDCGVTDARAANVDSKPEVAA